MKMRAHVFIIFILITISISAATIQSNESGNWNSASTWVGGIIPGQNDDIVIVNGHSITLTADASVNNISITNGNISIDSYSLSIYGDITGQINNIYSTANSTLVINNNGSASIFDIPTNISKLKKLVINRSTGVQTSHSLDLDDAVPADSIVLILTNGILYMKNNSIFYMNSQAVKRDIPCSDASFIDGPVQRDVKKNSGMHVFPIGNNGIARPMSLEAQNGTSNINQVQFIYSTPPNNLNVNIDKLPGGIFQNFYWDHQLISSANTQRRLYYEDSDFPGISQSDISNYFYLANTDGIKDWDIPTTPRTVDIVNKWISFDNSNASNDRYWTFGSNNIDVQINTFTLPIELSKWVAENKGSYIQLEWTTLTEKNNNFFEIERSEDGDRWQNVSTVFGAGNSTEQIDYSDLDDLPLPDLSYYKLKQVDYDGKSTYSDIETVNRSEMEDGYIHAVYNKNTETITIQSNNLLIDDIFIRTTTGVCLNNNVSILQLSDNMFQISISELPEGMYIIQTADNSTVFYKK